MSNFVAIYDACVLYPQTLRDLLMRLALTGLYRARWTAQIQDEWIQAVHTNRPDIPLERLENVRMKMEKAVPDCIVTGYTGFADSLTLRDEGDRHVMAAAIRCQAGVIVTSNVKDFPTTALQSYGIDVQHPDDFICHLFDLSTAAVCSAVKEQRGVLKNPPKTIEELLETYLSLGLTTTVESLRTMQQLL